LKMAALLLAEIAGKKEFYQHSNHTTMLKSSKTGIVYFACLFCESSPLLQVVHIS
jgi:hypothetical protein